VRTGTTGTGGRSSLNLLFFFCVWPAADEMTDSDFSGDFGFLLFGSDEKKEWSVD
jgi:hypothetical protein